jgi:hypothetical protein
MAAATASTDIVGSIEVADSGDTAETAVTADPAIPGGSAVSWDVVEAPSPLVLEDQDVQPLRAAASPPVPGDFGEAEVFPVIADSETQASRAALQLTPTPASAAARAGTLEEAAESPDRPETAAGVKARSGGTFPP